MDGPEQENKNRWNILEAHRWRSMQWGLGQIIAKSNRVDSGGGTYNIARIIIPFAGNSTAHGSIVL